MNITVLFLSLKTSTSKNFALPRMHRNWPHYNTKSKRKEQACMLNNPHLSARKQIASPSRSDLVYIRTYAFDVILSEAQQGAAEGSRP